MKPGKTLVFLFAVILFVVVASVPRRHCRRRFRVRGNLRCMRRPSYFRNSSVMYGGDEQKSRIVCGANAFAGEYPFMVGIWLDGSPNCGGALISNWWMLTAAHCVKEYSLEELDVRIGTTLAIDNEGTKVQVQKSVPHEKFRMDIEIYDIALLKAAEFIQYNENVQPIRMAPPGYEVPIGTKATVLGWGMTKTNDQSSYPIVLQFAEIPIMSQEKCRKAYPAYEIMNNMLCAGYAEGRIDSCKGDSGGPLVFNDTLIGVVSFGDFCCGLPAVPGVYSKVSAFRAWIKKHSGL